MGTTEIINVLESVDREVTNTFGGDVTVKEEEEVGDQLLLDCRNQYRFIEKGQKIENLQVIMKYLTDQIKAPKGFHYKIYLIESEELNAFTAGAKIFVTTKMYNFCKTNDELACVIGHEINHNELGHIKEHLQKERLIPAEGEALAEMATISFGQKKETHCDMTGIDLAIAAGYNGCVNIDLWKRMQKEFDEGQFDALDNLMRSHPYSEKRAICTREHILKNYGFDCNSVEK
jgi:predicted Zn-dependent protease